MMVEPEQSFVLYDGDCTFCNRIVQFVLKRSNGIQLISLHSDEAHQILKQNYADVLAINTLVLFEKNVLYYKSNAVLRIFLKMKGFWPLLHVFKILPLIFRDKIYDIIATNRYRLFGKTESCMQRKS